jgi:hypothetical protein
VRGASSLRFQKTSGKGAISLCRLVLSANPEEAPSTSLATMKWMITQLLRVAMISQAMKHGNKNAGVTHTGNRILAGIERRKDCQVRGQTT